MSTCSLQQHTNYNGNNTEIIQGSTHRRHVNVGYNLHFSVSTRDQGDGEDIDYKGPQWNFWGAMDYLFILYYDCSRGNTTVYICQNSSYSALTLVISLYASYTSKKLTKEFWLSSQALIRLIKFPETHKDFPTYSLLEEFRHNRISRSSNNLSTSWWKIKIHYFQILN